MTGSFEQTQARPQPTVFAYLRRHNEYAAQVARIRDANRKRRVAQAVRAQRQQRVHQSR